MKLFSCPFNRTESEDCHWRCEERCTFSRRGRECCIPHENKEKSEAKES